MKIIKISKAKLEKEMRKACKNLDTPNGRNIRFFRGYYEGKKDLLKELLKQ